MQLNNLNHRPAAGFKPVGFKSVGLKSVGLKSVGLKSLASALLALLMVTSAMSETREAKVLAYLSAHYGGDKAPLNQQPPPLGDPQIAAIIGGNDAAKGEYGEFTSLITLNSKDLPIGLCGGSLIAPNKVLTAAHCVANSANSYDVIPGFHAVAGEVTEADVVTVSKVAVHPRYNVGSRFDYDVAVLTLDRDFSTEQANVYSGEKTFSGAIGTAIGYGRVSANVPGPSPVLQEVLAPIISNRQCADIWLRREGGDPITERMICAGFTTDNRGVCSGDSGSALFINFKEKRTVVGITSFGSNNCDNNRGNQTFARVGVMTDFIRRESPQTQFVGELISEPDKVLPAIMLLLLDS